ncbi:ubiquitin receptor RAD23c-like [Chenopodium quinoa]|uniref:ubiquitin receptor RAD23c-like n=1 Tax=Chenopodium quinoa TaxID=63459 RepID=UPI000B7895CC|nr:ubiquitin receptor RAD23c-like [Chenopodium quinoa]
MKVKIQGLGTPRIEIEVNPDDKISDLKKKIEGVFGANDFPAATQILVNRRRYLKCEHSTLRELNVVGNGKIGVIAAPIMRNLMPKPVWASAAGSSSPAQVASVISSAVPKPPKLNAQEVASLRARTQDLALND